jgi:hypothetical protein
MSLAPLPVTSSSTDNAIPRFDGAVGLLQNSSVTIDDSNGVAGMSSVNSGPMAGFRNVIINGAMMVAQRGTSFTSATTVVNNDDAYTLDRWYILSDGNDVVDVTQESSTVPTNGLRAIALDVETANKKFGLAQIIEQKNCIGLIGNTVTLSFKAKVSATTNLDNVKAAIIAWSGTADTVTSDIISAWGIEGTDPTLIANATYENTPANLSLTTSYATYSVSAAVDTASTKNIIVFIWSDVTTTSTGGSDILYVTDVQLEIGSTATPFERRPFSVEQDACLRYFQKWGGSNLFERVALGTCVSTTRCDVLFNPSIWFRVVPAVTVNSAANFAIYDGALTACTAVAIDSASSTVATVNIQADVASGLTVGRSGEFITNNTTSAYIALDSEM